MGITNTDLGGGLRENKKKTFGGPSLGKEFLNKLHDITAALSENCEGKIIFDFASVIHPRPAQEIIIG